MDIDELMLSIRSSNALRASGINTIEELIKIPWDDVMAMKHIGVKCGAEIAWACVLFYQEEYMKRIKTIEEIDELKIKAKKYDLINRIVSK